MRTLPSDKGQISNGGRRVPSPMKETHRREKHGQQGVSDSVKPKSPCHHPAQCAGHHCQPKEAPQRKCALPGQSILTFLVLLDNERLLVCDVPDTLRCVLGGLDKPSLCSPQANVASDSTGPATSTTCPEQLWLRARRKLQKGYEVFPSERICYEAGVASTDDLNPSST